ncbi:putative immunity protein [Tessaracoccus sp. MC1756]|uniref:putative immunity protein n=1 Tax=Tessaracoccus sp. MC1756 TaxID=2760311 RepID=UPI0016003E76|nr:hypothetical protein [Tessaracoccus sp. MC1756]MBB1510745.1 hypothetical protein [Tessaracoccus sp. MC1756]
MTSIQTLSEPERRAVARWAAACAEHVLPLFEADQQAEELIRDAVARAHAFARGESTAAAEIKLRMVAVKAAGAATTQAGAAAARSAGQAAAVAHMGAHALGAAAYAVKAAALANPQRPDSAEEEVAWQLSQLSAAEREALRLLPELGSTSGPLGPGLLAQGILGDTIRHIQATIMGER